MIDTTAQKPTDREPVSGGPSIEGYTPVPADKIADIPGIERKRRSYERTATSAMGKNGKSTLVELFQDLMGDYSSVAHPDTIMRQRFSDATAQYQLAELTGVRFVGMAETKREVQLEESVVKQITGNDTISARSPYGRPFGYRPQFKIWFSTNHKPEIPEGSEAIWDRIKLIPFNKRFEGAGRTPI